MIEAEVIAIGNEVLSGAVVNSNAAFISQELIKVGIHVVRHSVVSDDHQSMKQQLQNALRPDCVVIASGGLGPTWDDNTRQVAADLFESDFHFDEEIANDIKRRLGAMAVSVNDQATVPSKAIALKNTIGTAPGSVFESEKGILILVPGVPAEMRAMITQSVIPWIQQRFPRTHRSFGRSIYFFGLPESSVDPHLRRLQENNPNVEFGIYPREALLTIRVSTIASSQESADQLLLPLTDELSKAFASKHFKSASGGIEEAIYDVMKAKKLTLSTAESFTGGAIAASLVTIPGASDYFVGSIVSYSYEMKKRLLGVTQETLDRFGAVSEPTVIEMVNGLLARTGSDWGIAVSGIAGPTGATPEKPVGTICCAMKYRDQEPEAWTFKSYGDRRGIIVRGTHIVLGELYRRIV